MYKVLTFLTLSLSVLIHFMALPVVALDTDGLVGVWLLDEGKGKPLRIPPVTGWMEKSHKVSRNGLKVSLMVQWNSAGQIW